jgi:hypothetical protein
MIEAGKQREALEHYRSIVQERQGACVSRLMSS